MKPASGDITWLDYAPKDRRLDVEVFSFSDLVRRSRPEMVKAIHRYNFHLLLLVTEGEPTQVVDFEPFRCVPGTMLTFRPGQVHCFGQHLNWDGLLVLFRPEVVPTLSADPTDITPGRILERLPNHIQLDEAGFEAARQAINTMSQDAGYDTSDGIVHALLRYQLCTLILRLGLQSDHRTLTGVQRSPSLKRFARFHEMLEANFAGWHQVSPYAKALGCTEKSLNRASRDAVGLNAKEYIARRVVLEAKRLLAHTDRPVYLIAEGLGFEEATNFSKFFRNKAGVAPAEFRASYR